MQVVYLTLPLDYYTNSLKNKYFYTGKRNIFGFKISQYKEKIEEVCLVVYLRVYWKARNSEFSTYSKFIIL